MKTLPLIYNLDDPAECEAFLNGHKNLSGIRLARVLGLAGKGSVTAGRNLLSYARLKYVATLSRSQGQIMHALELERTADALYMKLPESLRW